MNTDLEIASHAGQLLGQLITDEVAMPSEIVLVRRHDAVDVRYRVGTSLEDSWRHHTLFEGVDVSDAFRQLAAAVDMGEKFVAQALVRFPSARGPLAFRCTRSVESDGQRVHLVHLRRWQ